MALSIFALLCNHHYYLPPELFHYPKLKLYPLNNKGVWIFVCEVFFNPFLFFGFKWRSIYEENGPPAACTESWISRQGANTSNGDRREQLRMSKQNALMPTSARKGKTSWMNWGALLKFGRHALWKFLSINWSGASNWISVKQPSQIRDREKEWQSLIYRYCPIFSKERHWTSDCKCGTPSLKCSTASWPQVSLDPGLALQKVGRVTHIFIPSCIHSFIHIY